MEPLERPNQPVGSPVTDGSPGGEATIRSVGGTVPVCVANAEPASAEHNPEARPELESHPRRTRKQGRAQSWNESRNQGQKQGWLSALGALVVLCSLAWTAYVYTRIRAYSIHDEARPADAIAVFGAAEYDGRPSPVLRARLEHGLALYQEKLAPLIITLGGGDPGEPHSEGGVGQDYLAAHGVPESAIIAETRSQTTRESAERLAVIARANHVARIIVVSDGTHLFRIRALCTAAGLTVYTSPRQQSRALPVRARVERMLHEILSYTAFRLHIH